MKVLKSYRDKTDGKKRYNKGDSYSHKDEKRVAFLVEKGYLKEAPKKPAPKKEKAKQEKTKDNA